MRSLVRDVMTREVLVARTATTFRELVRLIEENHVHALPVIDDQRRVLGIVAGSDLLKDELTPGQVRRRFEHRRRVRPAGVVAGEIMTSPAVTIDQSQTLSHAARVLHQRHVGRLPVVDQDDRLIGIVTRSDLLTVFLASDEDLRVAIQEAIAAVEDPASIWADVEDGVVVLRGSAPLLSEVGIVTEYVRRVPGIVRLDVRATAVHDDVHPEMVGGRAVL
jgi:CBS-domain-containing membrane protein